MRFKRPIFILLLFSHHHYHIKAIVSILGPRFGSQTIVYGLISRINHEQVLSHLIPKGWFIGC